MRKFLYWAFLPFVVLVCCFLMSSCSSDDGDEQKDSSKSIVGEWISKNGIYYQFRANGTGRYICLLDEPGYDPEHPQAVIEYPNDPYEFEYNVKDNVLTMKEFYSDGYSVYVCDVVVSEDVLHMRQTKYNDDGGEWIIDQRPSWKTYLRWK